MNNSFSRIVIFASCLIMLSSFYNLHSQTHSRYLTLGVASDSLPFDGQSDIEFRSNLNNADECKVKVTYVEGDVRGVKSDTLIMSVCEGTNKDTLITMREVDLKLNNVLTPPTHIKTGDRSRAEITFPDGSTMRIAPNTDFDIQAEGCNATVTPVDKSFTIKNILGNIWSQFQQGSYQQEDQEHFEAWHVSTVMRGTTFSFESKIDGKDTVVSVRTYEGEVDVAKTSGTDKTLTSAEDQLKKLQEDYQNGKITMQEFQQKATDLSKNVNEYNKSANTVTVEAGYQTVVKTDSPPSTPEKFEPDPNPWFKDSNFGK